MSKGKTTQPAELRDVPREVSGHAAARAAAAGHARHPARQARRCATSSPSPSGTGVNFCGATVLLDAKGQTFDRIDNGGRDGDPDAISTAVPGSLAPVPWAQVPTAQVLLAMDDCERRAVLRRSAAGAAQCDASRLQDMGLTAVAATELEFYLLEPDAERPTPQGRAHSRHATSRRTARSTACMEDVEDVDPFLAELYSTSARRRTFRPARRSRNSRRASSRSICITSRAPSSPAITPCCSSAR